MKRGDGWFNENISHDINSSKWHAHELDHQKQRNYHLAVARMSPTDYSNSSKLEKRYREDIFWYIKTIRLKRTAYRLFCTWNTRKNGAQWIHEIILTKHAVKRDCKPSSFVLVMIRNSFYNYRLVFHRTEQRNGVRRNHRRRHENIIIYRRGKCDWQESGSKNKLPNPDGFHEITVNICYSFYFNILLTSERKEHTLVSTAR